MISSEVQSTVKLVHSEILHIKLLEIAKMLA
jgi:hypothetical protein